MQNKINNLIILILGTLLILFTIILGPAKEPQAEWSTLYIRVVKDAIRALTNSNAPGVIIEQAPKPNSLLQNYYYCPSCKIYHPKRSSSNVQEKLLHY